ncbi:MAG: NADP-dependent oxidoreductase [Burkholderiales bacterium]
MPINHAIVLDNRPEAEVSTSNFKMVTAETPALQDGQVLVKNHYLSLDPYMRGRMNAGKNYAQPQPLGEPMIGGTVGEVAESKNAKFKVGQTVQCMGGWQAYSLINADMPGALKHVNAEKISMSHYLGAVGMPGVTAWYGLNKIIQAKPGATVTVSAASGAVGSAYGALAKARGFRVVGIAGGKAKCDYVVNELGFDACIDYKAHTDYISLSKALRDACPNGIDGHFENVGGMVLDAVMLRANDFSRIAVCGMIAGYNGEPLAMTNPTLILKSRMTIEGFIVSEHMEVWPEALAELAELIASGKFNPRQTIAQGLASAPEDFMGLLKGHNFGKQVVKLI